MAIPYGKQNITQQDIEAVVEALQADFLTQGPRINAFEEAFAKYVGSKFAVAVSNGTAALAFMCYGYERGARSKSNNYTYYVCR
jgi:dTDP-4-amino-4,6-dideoxygalactose transaminase